MSPSEMEKIKRHRDEAFIECPRPLWIEPARIGLSAGPQVVPLTWLRYHQLSGEQHRILAAECGQIPRAELLRSLWVLSPSFSHSRTAWRIFRIRHTLTTLRHRQRLQSHLRAFILDAFLEDGTSKSQPSSLKSHPSSLPSLPPEPPFPSAHLLANVITGFARLYGWTRRDILEMPIAQFYQLQNVLNGQGNPEAGEPAFNAVEDRKTGDRLRAKQAARREAAGQKIV